MYYNRTRLSLVIHSTCIILSKYDYSHRHFNFRMRKMSSHFPKSSATMGNAHIMGQTLRRNSKLISSRINGALVLSSQKTRRVWNNLNYSKMYKQTQRIRGLGYSLYMYWMDASKTQKMLVSQYICFLKTFCIC